VRIDCLDSNQRPRDPLYREFPPRADYLHDDIGIGKLVSERNPTRGDVRAWADATAAMLNGYLAQLAPRATRSR